MLLESLKSGKFASKVLSPEIERQVSGGIEMYTDHFETGRRDYANYSRCGPGKLEYDMKVTMDDGKVIQQGVGAWPFAGTQDWWYQ